MFIWIPPQQQQQASEAVQPKGWLGSTPQSVDLGRAAGIGLVFAALALFAPQPPVYASSQEHRFGTHEVAVRDSVAQSSRTWNTVKPPTPAAQRGNFVATLPQSYSTYGSAQWCAAEYVTTVAFLSQEPVGEQEEPRYQPSSFWRQQLSSVAAPPQIVRPVQAAVQAALYQPGSSVRGDVAQYARLQVLIPEPIIQIRQEFRQEGISGTFSGAVFAPPQPADTGASYSYGSHSAIYEYAGRSSVWGTAEQAPPTVSLAGKVLLTSQESAVVGQSFVERSWLYFDSPKIRPISGYQEPDIQVSGSRITESWQFPLVIPQSPPNRPAIQTSAEVPLTAPSSVWGSVATYAPVQPGDAGASYAFGQHARVYEYAGLSKVWGRPGFTPPVVQSPPLRGAIVTSQDPLGALQNWSTVWPTPVAQLVPFITTAVVGDFDPPIYQPSSFWRYPHVGVAPASPLLRPIPFPFGDLRADLGVPQSIVWGQATYVTQVIFLASDVVGEQDAPPYQPSDFWRSGLTEAPPPPTVVRPIPADQRVSGEFCQQPPSSLWAPTKLPLVQSPPLRGLVVTYPQSDIQIRPSDVWGQQPPTAVVVPTARPRFAMTLPAPAVYYEQARSQFHSPLIRYTYMGRIVTYPKYLGETEQLLPPFDFSGRMGVSETISSVSVSVSVYSGVDANPSAIKSGSPTISGKKVYQNFTGGVVGVIYLVSCTANTSAGQVLQLNTYFYVEPDLP